jgi:hypothetical protein
MLREPALQSDRRLELAGRQTPPAWSRDRRRCRDHSQDDIETALVALWTENPQMWRDHPLPAWHNPGMRRCRIAAKR